ncbi:hypothetical protein C8T65DRAFT_654962 [Cerioporus squamosus]|nr:hypothetical protein C8T65DRAFT_654962 [Cerioporus squamosus]
MRSQTSLAHFKFRRALLMLPTEALLAFDTGLPGSPRSAFLTVGICRPYGPPASGPPASIPSASPRALSCCGDE